MAAVQLLSVESISGSPCTVITTDNGRFMFDVGEARNDWLSSTESVLENFKDLSHTSVP